MISRKGMRNLQTTILENVFVHFISLGESLDTALLSDVCPLP